MIDHFVITSWGRSTYNATSCFFSSQQRWNHIHIELLQWQGTSGIQNWKRKDLICKTYKRIEQKPWHKKKLFPLCSLATVGKGNSCGHLSHWITEIRTEGIVSFQIEKRHIGYYNICLEWTLEGTRILGARTVGYFCFKDTVNLNPSDMISATQETENETHAHLAPWYF